MRKAGSSNAVLNGFMALTRNSRMLYAHAYQSYVWNQVASFRLQMSHETCKYYIVAGDLIQDTQDHVAYLTEENKKKFTIHDVVLPLPGSKIL